MGGNNSKPVWDEIIIDVGVCPISIPTLMDTFNIMSDKGWIEDGQKMTLAAIGLCKFFVEKKLTMLTDVEVVIYDAYLHRRIIFRQGRYQNNSLTVEGAVVVVVCHNGTMLKVINDDVLQLLKSGAYNSFGNGSIAQETVAFLGQHESLIKLILKDTAKREMRYLS